MATHLQAAPLGRDLGTHARDGLDVPNQHMASIVDSVIESGMTDALAACTSMHDVMVVPTPIQEPPYDLVAVRAPGSLRKPTDGFVLIEHLSVTGHNDEIERPVEDAVPLFWRFIVEKFGMTPNWPAHDQVGKTL